MTAFEYEALIDQAREIAQSGCVPTSWEIDVFKIVLADLIAEEHAVTVSCEGYPIHHEEIPND